MRSVTASENLLHLLREVSVAVHPCLSKAHQALWQITSLLVLQDGRQTEQAQGTMPRPYGGVPSHRAVTFLDNVL